MPDIETRWTETAWTVLKGRTIEDVRYMTQKEADDEGWSTRPLVMFLDSGDWIVPMQDDEGNNGGSLAHLSGVLPVI